MSEYKNGSLVGAGGDSFTSLVISEDGSHIVATDASSATSFFLDLAQSDITGVTFDGVNGSCSIPNAGIEPASVSWWLEFTLLQNTTSERVFIHAGSPGDVMSVYYYGATTDLVEVSVRTSAGVSSLFTSGALTISTKYQLSFTYDGSTVASLYLDGVLQDSDATTGSLTYSGSGPFWLASYHGWTQFNNMQFSNVAVFDYALPASELLELKAETKIPTTTTTPALSWWPCNDTAGTTLTDTISARNGTLSGGFTFDASAQAFTLANPSGLTAGQSYRWLVETGGLRTCTYGSKFVSEGAASLEISQGAGDKDMIVGTVSDDGAQIFARIEKDFS